MPRCDHCLIEFPEHEALREEIDGIQKTFCCNGCRGIFTLIHSEGLDSFYLKRKWDETGIDRALLDRAIDADLFSEQIRTVKDWQELDVYIDGIRCASCVWLNEKVLSKTAGIEHVRVNYATHRARLRWDPSVIGLKQILSRIQSIGYTPKPYSESEHFRLRKAETRDLLVRFGTAAFLSSQLMVYSIALYAGYFQGIDASTKLLLEVIAMLLTFPIVFYSGSPFIKSTLTGLRHFRFNMDTLIVVGTMSAFIYSIYEMTRGGTVYFDTSAMIVTLILLGRYIEATAKGKASETIERLTELRPREARLLRPDEEGIEQKTKVPIDSIRPGDRVEVLPGERVPLDGLVLSGNSEVDESLLTGESRPVPKAEGSPVIGGSMNLYGAFIFSVTRTGKETVLAGIIRAVEDAQAEKPHIQNVADRIVGYFVPAILILAAATVAGYILMGAPLHQALMTGVSVLVIACPCSLGLATPIAVLIFTGRASARGVLIRSGDVIEETAEVTDIVFDKTGTITTGRPRLREIVMVDAGEGKEEILASATAIESLSEHSIGHAIVDAARGLDRHSLPQVSDFLAVPGRGVRGVIDRKGWVIGNLSMMSENGISVSPKNASKAAMFESEGDTVVYAGSDGTLKAMLVISDMVRDEARRVVDEIKGLGISVSIVSGDNTRTTSTIASNVGVLDAKAEATPAQKREIVASMQNNGVRVMMIGDGINDAPALTQSSVGVAMGRGTDIAMESADAVLVRNDLGLLPFMIRLSRKTYGIIKQNIFWAFFYNIVAIPLAVAGQLHPIVAAGAMAASSLAVVGNSLRIKKKEI